MAKNLIFLNIYSNNFWNIHKFAKILWDVAKIPEHFLKIPEHFSKMSKIFTIFPEKFQNTKNSRKIQGIPEWMTTLYF